MASCIHKDICSGCPWIELPETTQKNQKIQSLSETLMRNNIAVPTAISYRIPASFGLRDRVDLTYQNGQYGFYQKSSREIFSVKECPQMSANLFDLFKKISEISIPIQKGSLRLRVGANDQNLRGIWLDFANTDIQYLFEEKTTLHRLLEIGHVEVGQRRKNLSWSENESRFRLQDPMLRPWLRSWQQDQSFDLYSLIGSFSQTGDFANKILIQTIEGFLSHTSAKNWVEFGCGSGNLTIPLAGDNRNVTAVEYDEAALSGLKKTLGENPELSKRITLQAGDFQKKDSLSFSQVDGILVNPPRSGLGNFLAPLEEQKDRPQDFIYMSCFLDSFAQDAVQLKNLSYVLQELTIVDQFPQTPHFEILSRWMLID